VSARLPFGPYAGRPLDQVAALDPGYLLGLIEESLGSDAVRAEAARCLARRGRLGPGVSDGEPTPPSRVRRARVSLVTAGIAAATVVLGAVLASLPDGLSELGDRVVQPTAGVGWDSLDGGNANPAGGGRAQDLDVAKPDGMERSSGGGGRSSGADQSRPSDEADTSPRRANTDRVPGVQASAPCGARVEGAIPAESAQDYLDTHQAVEFRVVRTKDTGRVTFLNANDPYEGHFYVAVFPDDYAAFPEPPALFFKNRCIVIRGTIELYRGSPQIVLRHPDDVRIVAGP